MGYGHGRYRYVAARRASLFAAIYLVLGLLVAAGNDYFDRLTTFGRLVSALLAVVLWPLLLVGLDIRVR